MQKMDGRFSAIQYQGDRDYQEDDYGLLDGSDLRTDGSEHTMLVLADGMGGHLSGDVASALVVKTVITKYQTLSGPTGDRLRDTMMASNIAIQDAILEKSSLGGMGCTLVMVLISKNGVEWLSVGDSPLWLYRDGELNRLNADHSMAPVLEELVEVGKLTKEDAERDPQKHTLRSAIYGEEINLVDQSSQPLKIKNDDVLVLASDGLETLDSVEIESCFRDIENTTLEAINEELIDKLKQKAKPNQDNTTVLLYRPSRAVNEQKTVNKDSELSEEITIQIGSQERKKITHHNFSVRPFILIMFVVSLVSFLIYQYVTKDSSTPKPVEPTIKVEDQQTLKQASSSVPTEIKDVKVEEETGEKIVDEPPLDATKGDSIESPKVMHEASKNAEVPKAAEAVEPPELKKENKVGDKEAKGKWQLDQEKTDQQGRKGSSKTLTEKGS